MLQTNTKNAAPARSGRAPLDADRIIGQRIREVRVVSDVSLQDLAPKIGITWQQLQKYEAGANRISAGRLVALAEALDVPVAKFFDGLTTETRAEEREPDRSVDALIRTFVRVPPEQRKKLVAVVRAFLSDEAGAAA